MISRKLKGAHLPGAPDGEYVVIQYDSSFGSGACCTGEIQVLNWRLE